MTFSVLTIAISGKILVIRERTLRAATQLHYCPPKFSLFTLFRLGEFSFEVLAEICRLITHEQLRAKGARKNYLDSYVLLLFEISTLPTKNYNLSLDSLNNGKLLEQKKV